MTDRPARDRLLTLVSGYRLTEAIVVASRLGITDALSDGPLGLAELAQATGSHAPTLHRLLRVLSALGIVEEQPDARFAVGELGDLLRADAPWSVRDWALFVGRPYHRSMWAALEHSVRTGENAFESIHGEGIWAWRSHEPEESMLFDRAMRSLTRGIGAALSAAFPFERGQIVADIAGGTGVLLAELLAGEPGLRAILFDQPHVVAGAADTLAAAGVADRVSIVGGSFFESVPEADVYLMKSILHDWDDDAAGRILRTIRRDGGHAPLLLIEAVAGEGSDGLATALSDLQMLVGPGGRERTLDEWRALLLAGGYALRDVRPLLGTARLIVSEPESLTAEERGARGAR